MYYLLYGWGFIGGLSHLPSIYCYILSISLLTRWNKNESRIYICTTVTNKVILYILIHASTNIYKEENGQHVIKVSHVTQLFDLFTAQPSQILAPGIRDKGCTGWRQVFVHFARQTISLYITLVSKYLKMSLSLNSLLVHM